MPQNQKTKSKKIVNRKFEMASAERVAELGDYIGIVLDALGHSEALVTDESQLFDFFDIFNEGEENIKLIGLLSKKLGVEIHNDSETVVDIAQKLKDKEDASRT